MATVHKDWLMDTISSHDIKPLYGRFCQECNIWLVMKQIYVVRLYYAIDGHREAEESWIYFPTRYIVILYFVSSDRRYNGDFMMNVVLCRMFLSLVPP